MNESQRRQKAETLVMAERAKHQDLPEPEQTYAVETAMALEIGRLREEVVEQRYIRRYSE
jgi:hypothetical protein